MLRRQVVIVDPIRRSFSRIETANSYIDLASRVLLSSTRLEGPGTLTEVEADNMLGLRVTLLAMVVRYAAYVSAAVWTGPRSLA